MCCIEDFTVTKHYLMAAGRIGAFHEVIHMISNFQEKEETSDGKAALQNLVLAIRGKASKVTL